MARTKYRYVKFDGYESAYEAKTRYGVYIADVDRNGPNDWIAYLADDTSATGATRDAAVDAAIARRNAERGDTS